MIFRALSRLYDASSVVLDVMPGVMPGITLSTASSVEDMTSQDRTKPSLVVDECATRPLELLMGNGSSRSDLGTI